MSSIVSDLPIQSFRFIERSFVNARVGPSLSTSVPLRRGVFRKYSWRERFVAHQGHAREQWPCSRQDTGRRDYRQAVCVAPAHLAAGLDEAARMLDAHPFQVTHV